MRLKDDIFGRQQEAIEAINRAAEQQLKISQMDRNAALNALKEQYNAEVTTIHRDFKARLKTIRDAMNQRCNQAHNDFAQRDASIKEQASIQKKQLICISRTQLRTQRATRQGLNF